MLFGRRERTIRRILVVEDEPLVAFDNEQMLRDAGYEVVATVDTLGDARKAIAGEDIDLVLSDMSLRGKGDGMDVARLAKAKGVPVLFVTGQCPADAQSVAIGCLAKPYSEKALKETLRALEQRLHGKTIRKMPVGLSLYEAE